MTKKTRKSSKPAKPKSYILLGTNEYAKPRGARFSTDADPELLAKAAEFMHLWLIEVTNDELAELAAGLPAGRLHASGGGLVPYIKGELYHDLLGAAMPEELMATTRPGPHRSRPAAQLGRDRTRPSRHRVGDIRMRLVGGGGDRAEWRPTDASTPRLPEHS